MVTALEGTNEKGADVVSTLIAPVPSEGGCGHSPWYRRGDQDRASPSTERTMIGQRLGRHRQHRGQEPGPGGPRREWTDLA